MKWILIYPILLVSVIQIKTSEVRAQANNDSLNLNSSLYREKLHLFTDRNLYASGEELSFRLFNLSHPRLKESKWSRVFYLELINSRHEPLARGKYQVNSWGGDGQITIPDTASTGFYYLRAYTSWMRNYPPSGYFHLPLAIVNPHRIMPGDLSAGGKGTGTGTGIHEEAHEAVAGIVCSSDKSSYGKRERVSVRIHPGSGDSSPDGYCISVVKKGYLDEAYPYTSAPVSEDPLQLKDLDHYPETRGATISGIVLLGEEEKPADRCLLGLTMLGPDPDYVEFKTDGNGRFRISVQQQRGSHDALLTIKSNPGEAVKILMNEAFSSDFSTAPLPAADFFGERSALVEDAMVNAQLRAAFELPKRDPTDTAEANSKDLFYGIPEFRYRTDDYVALPDLEEFFFELVPQVRVEKNEDHAELVVLDDDGEILYTPPLILLDYVPVREIGKLLPLSPQRIDHIDIVNRSYVRGGVTYGGIINIITGRGDRAGIALPAGSSFITYTGLSKPQKTISPEYEGTVRNDRLPDLRNMLYWAAHQKITPDKGANLEFYTSDVTGEFMVIVRGMTPAGDVLSGTCKFTVK